MKRSLLTGIMLTMVSGACSQHRELDLTPFTPSLKANNQRAWFEHVQPHPEELGWTLWNWNPQLAAAARLASASDQPLLLWLENGHPLGSTSKAGSERRSWWMNPDLNATVARFVVAADDIHVLHRAQSAEGALFTTLVEQTPDQGAALLRNGGVLMASASGKLLGSYCREDGAALKDELRAALANWDKLPRGERCLVELGAMVSDGRSADFFPDDGLALEVHRRLLAATLDLDAPRYLPYTHDYLWFSATEVAQMIPTKMGQTLIVPPAQAQRLALFTMVDDLQGDGQAFATEDLLPSNLTFTSISKIGNTLRFAAHGEFAASSKTHNMRCVMEGLGSVNLAQKSILSLNLVVQAQSWGSAIEPLADGSWPLLGMSFHRADSVEGSHRIAPAQFDQYPASWPVTE
jgi:hypothetical protein